MKPKARILVVEDNALLYKKIKTTLEKEHYQIEAYCPSVDLALKAIHKKVPDLALLDISLKGNQTGLELGNKLYAEYDIPFIYLTDYEDDHTFFKGLDSGHEHFIVKSKFHSDAKGLIRTIQTTLSKWAKKKIEPSKEALMCFPDYVINTKQGGKTELSEIPILIEDIALITTNDTHLNEEKSKATGKSVYAKLKPNYTRIETWKGRSFYLPVSLKEIAEKLPLNLVRINESEIVNLSEHILDGRINGTRLKIGERVHNISKTYKSEVENRFRLLYQNLK